MLSITCRFTPIFLAQVSSRAQTRIAPVTDYVCRACHQLATRVSSQHSSSSTLNQRFLSSSDDRASLQCRSIASSSTAAPLSLFGKFKEKLGFTGKLRYQKGVLMRSSLRLYLCCVELPDYEVFFKELGMEDTFQSWYRVTELHVWLAMVRLASEGREGQVVRKQLVANMWQDVEKRSSSLGGSSTVRKEQIYEISQQFKAALFSYDEGALSDDKVLAGALWRNFFHMSCEKPQQLELLVQYVRKQLSHLDHQESQVLLRSGLVCWLPLHGTEEDQQRNNQILKYIAKRA